MPSLALEALTSRHTNPLPRTWQVRHWSAWKTCSSPPYRHLNLSSTPLRSSWTGVHVAAWEEPRQGAALTSTRSRSPLPSPRSPLPSPRSPLPAPLSPLPLPLPRPAAGPWPATPSASTARPSERCVTGCVWGGVVWGGRGGGGCGVGWRGGVWGVGCGMAWCGVRRGLVCGVVCGVGCCVVCGVARRTARHACRHDMT